MRAQAEASAQRSLGTIRATARASAAIASTMQASPPLTDLTAGDSPTAQVSGRTILNTGSAGGGRCPARPLARRRHQAGIESNLSAAYLAVGTAAARGGGPGSSPALDPRSGTAVVDQYGHYPPVRGLRTVAPAPWGGKGSDPARPARVQRDREG